MAFEDLEAHLVALGIVPVGEAFEPIAPDTWRPIEAATGGAFPDDVRWLFARFGGFQFSEDPWYHDPRSNTESLLGWFLSGPELTKAFDDTRGSLPDDVVPLSNDGGDNFICVGVGDANRGAVSFYLHDAPTDRNLYALADSVEAFLSALHREDDAAGSA